MQVAVAGMTEAFNPHADFFLEGMCVFNQIVDAVAGNDNIRFIHVCGRAFDRFKKCAPCFPNGVIALIGIGNQNVNRALAAADRTYVLNTGAIAMSGKSSELGGSAAFDAAYFGVASGAGKP